MASGLWKIAVLALVTLFAIAFAGRDLNILTKASDIFSSHLLSKVRKSFRNRNVVISPVSLHPVLAMLEIGAKGKTKKQLLRAIAMPNREVDWGIAYSKLNHYLKDPAFTTASAIILDSDIQIKSSYINKIYSIGSSLKRVNFTNGVEASGAINNWINTYTKGRISELFGPGEFNKNMAMVVANAVHFKADWKYKFDAAEMKDFHSPTGIIEVPMMYNQANFLYGELNELQAQVVALPYKSSKFKMLIVLPFEDIHLDVVQDRLAKIGLRKVWKSLTKQEVIVEIPKFKIESELELKRPLRSMGITRLFDSRADLSGIADDLGRHHKLYLSNVRQKVLIEVHEEGTEAAAVTVLGTTMRSAYQSSHIKSVIADRPFLFSVCAEGVQLVTGRMLGRF